MHLIYIFLIFRSKWYTNEHFRGSYTFQSTISEEIDVRSRDLAEPILDGNKPVRNFTKTNVTFLIINI